MSKIIQNKSIHLMHRFFRWNIGRVAILCAVLFIWTWAGLLYSASGGVSLSPYAVHVDNQLPIVFGFATIACVLALMLGGYTRFYRRGGAATLMLLPMRRRNVFLGMCAVGAVSMLLVFAVQTAAIFSAYPAVSAHAEAEAISFAQYHHIDLPFSTYRVNGLFEACMNSALLRLLLPTTPLEGAATLLFLLCTGCAPAFVLFGAKRRLATPFACLTVLCMAGFFYLRFGIWQGSAGIHYLIPILVMAVVLAYMLFFGIRRLNRHANLF